VTVSEGRKVQVVVISYLVLRRVIIILVGEVEIEIFIKSPDNKM